MIIENISKANDLSLDYVSKVIRSANHRYKSYTIKKRSGGDRLINHPAKELKLLQRWVADNIFCNFPIHESVYSYRVNVSIRNLAMAHKNYNYMLKVDFNDFFYSLKSTDISNFINSNKHMLNIPLSNKDIAVICQIVCKGNCITIGSPSSPIISNVILYEFDKFWYNKAKNINVKYSRYADDIYFSTNKPNVLTNVLIEFRAYLKKMKSPKLSLNDDKTVFTSRKHTKIVTGLIVTSDKKVSIGRDKKRYIKSLVYKFSKNELNSDEISYLKGYLSFINSVDKDFLKSLRKKYGRLIVHNILKYESPQKV